MARDDVEDLLADAPGAAEDARRLRAPALEGAAFVGRFVTDLLAREPEPTLAPLVVEDCRLELGFGEVEPHLLGGWSSA